MARKFKTRELHDIMDWNEVLYAIPYGHENCVHITVMDCCVPWDFGIIVRIAPVSDGRPSNIAEAHEEFDDIIESYYTRQEYLGVRYGW